MKAIVQDRFGPPDQLRLASIDPPGIGPGEVLIRVHAAALNPYDWHMLRGDPYIARLMGGTGLTRPKSLVAGIDAAGRVEAAGPACAACTPARPSSASARVPSPSTPAPGRTWSCPSRTT